jgi:sphingomyelin phosphodiesterase acid-like 3
MNKLLQASIFRLSPFAGLFILMIQSQGFGRRQRPPAVNPSDTASPCFLLLSDIHLHGEEDQDAGVTRNSDSGKDLWDSAETKIRSVLSGRGGVRKPGFIIYLGDLPWHAKDSTDLPGVMHNAGLVLRDLRMLAEKAHVVLLFVPGNNDSEDGDYGAFSEKLFAEDSAGPGAWPLIDGARNVYSEVPSLGDTTALSMGCYSACPLKTNRRLVVLVLNTNVFTKKYGSMTGKPRQTADAETELKWLQGQLAVAAASHRHVLIAMHVPPGKDGYLKAEPNRETCTGNFKDLWDSSVRVDVRVEGRVQRDGEMIPAQDAFLDLMQDYRSSIISIVSSHTHMDGLRLLKTRTGEVSTLLISAPGIAPGHGNNPGFKTVSYDPSNFQLNGFTSFYNNFYPDRTVKSWGNRSFRFGKGSKTSLLEQVQRMPDDSLRKKVNSIYTLYNGDGYSMGNCVDTTLFVHYQQ